MKIVLANGCFDLLHAGHVRHLQQARCFGDVLIVSLTEDAHVNKGSGRPINTWQDRARVLLELRCVSDVIPCRNAFDALWKVRPDIFVKGIDYVGGNKFTEEIEKTCAEVGAELRYTSTVKQSVTDIIRKAMA